MDACVGTWMDDWMDGWIDGWMDDDHNDENEQRRPLQNRDKILIPGFNNEQF